MALKNRALDTQVPRETSEGLFDLRRLTEKELLQLRAQIDATLEIGNLADLDIGHEIVLQLRALKVLQHEALKDSEAPHGQKAQASNAVTRMLSDLSKSRYLLYNAERIKQIELMTIAAIKEAPEEAQAAFFERLERYLATLPTLTALMAEASEEQ